MGRSKRLLVTSLTLALVFLVAGAAWAQRAGDRGAKDSPGWLGVSIQEITNDVRDALPRSVREGVIVTSVVDGSPADELGLEEGDVITRFNREPIRKTEDLTRAVRDAGAEQTVDIEYYRDGRLQRDRVTLAETSGGKARERVFTWRDRDRDRDREHKIIMKPGEHRFTIKSPKGILSLYGGQPILGVKLMDMGEQLAEYFDAGKSGALITEVMEDSPAEKAGLKAGDVITSIDGQDVESADDVRRQLRKQEDSEEVNVEVLRHGRTQNFTANVEKSDMEWYTDNGPGMPGLMYRPYGDDEDFDVPAPDMKGFEFMMPDREKLKDQLEDLRQQMKELKKELSELKSERP